LTSTVTTAPLLTRYYQFMQNSMSIVTIQIAKGDKNIFRRYALNEGQLPDNMQENLQEMVDEIKN